MRIGSNKAGQGQQAPVAQAIVEPDYLATDGHDITLLKLASPSKLAPTPVAGASEGALWTAGTLETIAGWGTTSEGGDTPDTLQEAQAPITTDAYCGGAYSDFDPQTMVCAGFEQGASTRARATRAGRCSAGRPQVRSESSARPASATAAHGRASPASTRGWPTRRCGSGSAPRRRTP